MNETFTIIDDGRTTAVDALVAGERVRLSAAALPAALGWGLKPGGLGKDSQCVVLGRTDLRTDDGIDLAGVATALSRPVAIDTAERVAYLGASADARGAQLAALDAPDFTLPDLSGRLHSLSEQRGR